MHGNSDVVHAQIILHTEQIHRDCTNRCSAVVCMQVLTMFEKADAEYAELSQKKQILHMDKDKIEKVLSQTACVQHPAPAAMLHPHLCCLLVTEL